MTTREKARHEINIWNRARAKKGQVVAKTSLAFFKNEKLANVTKFFRFR